MDIIYRAHTTPELMSGYKSIGLTETQAQKLATYNEKINSNKKLTILQEQEYKKLLVKLMEVPELGKTSKSCILEYFIERQTNRKKLKLYTKEIKKGILTENEAIALYRQVNQTFCQKNTERKIKGLLSGECDLKDLPYAPNRVTDIKVAWDLKGLKGKTKEETATQYYWQLVSYGILFNKNQGEIAWCLTDLPEQMLQDEIQKICYAERLSPETSAADHDRMMEIEEELTRYYTYPDLTPQQKVVSFIYDLPNKDKDALLEQLERCKQYELSLSL